ncbi:MAG: hypothetical protein A2787_04270 [Omnitrophica WOR_2 bacterium RIFCSPHIGHO2_01_FULL_48_9]|uniref:Glycosyltransferase 2-like domain-containing protein n=1 Tax=Candidatus Sungbacteria bacterium RIFCSPHIGHO2_02_FULL_47_11 TaxID=1802270 RepID=A0A1G2KLL8_9BACT|nr:MAG: hypothetical protein A2787_04270 [Omnitrophica WOR_2 bacterium RIFCSPHIGHO2_01_FULL_48_9]OHA00343.1 MAG: hypothetical protein A3C07_01865 [Candidatus Sungbacteria bacterium RIFCSPHIGHO2_02_FULL_47_11]
MKLSVIIPAYNEKNTVASIIHSILAVQIPSPLEKELIIVDDGSTDGTKEELQQFQHDPRIKIFFHEKNQGKTAAVRLGIKQATGHIVLFQDADLEYSPENYPQLLRPILNGEAVIVYGSRFLGKIKNMAWINRLANNLSMFTINLLYGSQITDFHTCFKVIKKDILDKIPITSERFSFDTEITARLLRKGYAIHEVPISYAARSRAEGKKITWGTAIETYLFLLRYRFFPDQN